MLTAASRLFILRHSERKERVISADSLKAAFSFVFTLRGFFKKSSAGVSEHKRETGRKSVYGQPEEKKPPPTSR